MLVACRMDSSSVNLSARRRLAVCWASSCCVRSAMNYRNQRNYENLEKRIFDGTGEYGIPVLKPCAFDGRCEFVPFSSASGCKKRDGKGVHFFVDDYRFNRLWSSPDAYIQMLHQFKYVMTPDFSTYTDFPKVMQIYNHYRKHWIGAYMQENGINVIPTISWSDESSYNWCFDGEPAHGVVAVSSVGTQNSRKTSVLFLNGYREMIRRLEPETIIFYGSVPEECTENIVHIRAFQEKFSEAKCDG